MTLRQKFGCKGTLAKTLCRGGVTVGTISTPIHLREVSDKIVEAGEISLKEISDKITLSHGDTIKSTQGKVNVC